MATIGRPREFDADKALDLALAVFWTKGYEGTSLMDLVDAVGINKPSLYATFGSKEELFFKALARYQERLTEAAAPSLSLPLAREGVEAFLRALATFQSMPGSPRGCLFVQGALVGNAESQRVAKALCEIREQGVEMFRVCLKRAQKQGELAAGIDIKALARYFGTVSQGLSVQAASGVPTKDLHKTIRLAMLSWPEPH